METAVTVWKARRQLAVALVLTTGGEWYMYSLAGQREGAFSVGATTVFVVYMAVLFAVMLAATSVSGHKIWLAIMTGLVVSEVVWVYSTLYYIYGTAHNFETKLTRIDAVYFTLTTLSTAGFGDIAPKSQPARLLVSSQIGVDLVFLVLLAGIAVSRFSERRQ